MGADYGAASRVPGYINALGMIVSRAWAKSGKTTVMMETPCNVFVVSCVHLECLDTAETDQGSRKALTQAGREIVQATYQHEEPRKRSVDQ